MFTKLKNILIDIIAEAIKRALSDIVIRQKNPVQKWKTPEAAAKYGGPEFGLPYHFVGQDGKKETS